MVQVVPGGKTISFVEFPFPPQSNISGNVGGGVIIMIQVDAGNMPHPSAVKTVFPETTVILMGTPVGIPLKS